MAEGFSFFTHKAGGDANDAEIATWWNGVKGTDPAKVLLGAYWVLYPGHGAGAGDAFADRLDATCPGWGNRPFILQLDCEEWNGDSGTVPSKSEIQACANRLMQRAPKLRPIVYAPKWVYGNSLSGLGFPLWASNYSSASGGTASGIYAGIGGDNSSKWGAYSGQTPAILQFTSSATIAGQSTCDANAYRGTFEQLRALVAPGWIPAPPVEEPQVELTTNLGDQAYPNRTVGDAFRDLEKLRDFLVGDAAGTANANIKATAPVQRLLAISDLPATVAALTAAVLSALPPASTGGLTTDQVVAAVVEGVTTVALNGVGSAPAQ